jgi:hypothetical protein
MFYKGKSVTLKNNTFAQGWGVRAGRSRVFWLLWAGAAWKKQGVGAAWKKSQEPEPVKISRLLSLALRWFWRWNYENQSILKISQSQIITVSRPRSQMRTPWVDSPWHYGHFGVEILKIKAFWKSLKLLQFFRTWPLKAAAAVDAHPMGW